MLVFVDTEFTELNESGELLSIGLVSELDERMSLYREISGTLVDNCNDFVAKNVLPYLAGGATAKPLPEVAAEVWAWLAQLAEHEPVQLACDWSGDWAWTMLLLEVACQHGAPVALPPGLRPEPKLIWSEISSEAADGFAQEWRRANQLCNHHALHDALVNRATYLRFTPQHPKDAQGTKNA